MVWSALLFCWAGTAEPLGMPCPCDPSLWRDVGAPRSWWNLGCAAGANAAKFCDSWWVCQFHWVAYIYIYSKYMYLHSIVLKLYPSFPIKCSIIMGFFINWGNGRLEPARARETGLVGQVYQSYCYIYIYIHYININCFCTWKDVCQTWLDHTCFEAPSFAYSVEGCPCCAALLPRPRRSLRSCGAGRMGMWPPKMAQSPQLTKTLKIHEIHHFFGK